MKKQWMKSAWFLATLTLRMGESEVFHATRAMVKKIKTASRTTDISESDRTAIERAKKKRERKRAVNLQNSI